MKTIRNMFAFVLAIILLAFYADTSKPDNNLMIFSSTEISAQTTSIYKTQKIATNAMPPRSDVKIKPDNSSQISPKNIAPKNSDVESGGLGQQFNVEIIKLVNGERLKNSLSILTPNSALNRAAQLKVDDMVKNNYFAHTSPSGKTAAQFRVEGGYNGYLTGENLAVLFKTASEIVAAWMNSPTHKANILQGGYKDIGVATALTIYKGERTFFVAMEFGAKN